MSAIPQAAPRRPERPPKGEARQQALLLTAESLLQQGLFADASVADLAQAAGISRAAFYFYFASKETLLATVLDRAIQGFNDRIAAILDPQTVTDPVAAVRASVQAAAELWWHQAPVLSASVALGTRIPEVYDRTQANQAIVSRPTAVLLQQFGRVPEASDPDEADALVRDLTLSAERVFYHLMRGNPTEADLQRTTARITRIWLRAFGLDS